MCAATRVASSLASHQHRGTTTKSLWWMCFTAPVYNNKNRPITFYYMLLFACDMFDILACHLGIKQMDICMCRGCLRCSAKLWALSENNRSTHKTAATPFSGLLCSVRVILVNLHPPFRAGCRIGFTYICHATYLAHAFTRALVRQHIVSV